MPYIFADECAEVYPEIKVVRREPKELQAPPAVLIAERELITRCSEKLFFEAKTNNSSAESSKLSAVQFHK